MDKKREIRKNVELGSDFIRFVETEYQGFSFKYKFYDFDCICVYIDANNTKNVVLYDCFIDEVKIYTYRHFHRILTKMGLR